MFYKIDHDNDAAYIEYATQANGNVYIIRHYKVSGNTFVIVRNVITGKIESVTPLKQRFYAMLMFKHNVLGDYMEF